MYQAILKHGINLQHKAEQEDLKSRKSNYKGISKSTHHKNDQSIDQNLKHEMPNNALTFRQRDILSEKDDIIYGFKDYINSLQQYLLYDTWLGYIPDGANAWKLTKNVRIVALYNEKFSPVCPLPDKFLDISIYWRQKNVVSTEASMLLKHEDIHNSHQRELSKETSKALFRKHSKLAIIHPTTIKSKHFATSDQRVDKTPCIALYCQIKGIIPLGEREFDRVIDGWTIDVREGFCTFTVGGDLRPGTAIAGQATGDAGTMGAFVEDNSGRTAFITASHVVVNSSIRTYNSKQREEYLQTERIPVFRNTDPGHHIGNVIDWCFTSGDRNQRQGGVDAALVEVNKKLISTENMFPANKENLWKEEGYDGDELPKISTDKVLTRKDINEKSMLDSRILKYGMKTRITSGTFKYDGASIKVHNCNLDGSQRETVELYGLIAVAGKFGSKFSKPGDSGALCCIIDKNERSKMHPFGMLVAGDKSSGVGYISLLEDVFQRLNLDLDHAIKLYPPSDSSQLQVEGNDTTGIHVKHTEKAIQEIQSSLKKHEEQIRDVKCELGSLNTKMNTLIQHLLPNESQDKMETE